MPSPELGKEDVKKVDDHIELFKIIREHTNGVVRWTELTMISYRKQSK